MNAFHPYLLDRRLGVARTGVWIVLGIVILSFFRTQILGHGKYQLQSETNRLRPIPLPAPRGVIYDRNGRVLAENVPGYTVSLLPGLQANLRSTLARIAAIANIDSVEIERVLQRARKAPYQPALVLGDAPFSVVSALEERRVAIPGLLIQAEPKRSYPDTAIVAHLVGYVGEVTEGERGTKRFAQVRLGGLVGKDGLEREYDDTLRGSEGVRFVEVSARGQMVREAEAAANLAPVPGTDLHTTLDLDLQKYIAQLFPKGQRGAVMALNPNTGEVLALYSAPGFDPNAFVGGISAPYWRSLNENPARPLLDRAIQARYPPGSTWKLAVAAMGLKRGIVGPRSHMSIPCRGGLQFGNRFFRCWDAHGHGDLTLTEAIAQSCDVYFYQLGIKLGVSSLLEDANAWGFRGRTGIDLPGEIPSEFPTGPEYYDRLYGPRRWTSAVALNLAIGQGENAQTLIQMVRLYQQLASDGRMRIPFVVRPSPLARTENASLELTPEQIAILRRAMIAVVEQGTARGSRVAALTIAGKTGTSQNPHGPDHGWFIGFAPADKPEVVVGAIIEFSQHGTSVAPLVSRAIAHYLGIDEQTASTMRVAVPRDSAPEPFQLPALPADTGPIQLRLPAIRPVPLPTPPPNPGRPTVLSRVRQLDKALVVSVGLLALYGLATLYSAGQTDVPTFVATIWHRQLIWLGLGLVIAWATYRTSPRMLEWATPWVYAIAVFLLILTLLIGTGAGTAAGSKSWLAIAGVRFGQPAELAKLAVILMLARWLATLREAPSMLRDLIVPGLIAGLPCLLVLKQPDLGSAIVFVAILFLMLFWAGTKPSLLLLAASPVIGLVLAFSTFAWAVWIAVLAGLLLWWRPYLWEGFAVMILNVAGGVLALPMWNRLAPYQQNRLLAFLNPDVDPRAAGWHVIQSKVAVGSGGLLGKGFTEGTQKRLAFLPAQHTDFIFSIVGEELGFIGVLAALCLFAWLLFRLLRVARKATDPFSSLCVFGIAGLFFTHIVENVGMTVNLMPITGIPLPFFSYGGSFLLACSIGVGIALRVAWESRQSGYGELGQ